MEATVLLNQSVLVLNRNWIAVNVCDARRALVLLYLDLARVVTENYETLSFENWRDLSRYARENVVRTPRYQLMIPQVIKLLFCSRFPPLHVRFSRRNIYLRDRFQCQYCGARPPREELSIDHVVPRSRGGRTTWENVVLACTDCNARKGQHVLSECSMSVIRRPRRPHWLLSSHPDITLDNRPLWQKFIDEAYWNVELED